MTELDRVYPLGNPLAVHCRHCQRHRAQVGRVLVCEVCDLLLLWPRPVKS